MSKKQTDLIGQQFGNLTVNKIFKENGSKYCECRCTCGNIKTITFRRLKAGTCTHCGCQNKGGKDFKIKYLLQI